MKGYISGKLSKSIDVILKDYRKDRPIDSMNIIAEPDKALIWSITDQLFRIIYPGYFKDKTYRYYEILNNLTVTLEDIVYYLSRQIASCLKNEQIHQLMEEKGIASAEDESELLTPEEVRALEQKADRITIDFLNSIPRVREYLDTDLEAFFDGDPAAESRDEIILCYPGFYAITVYRLAHELYRLGVPMLPRIMTEYAHTQTGIDINPGATIGKYFFIDHGTGIVVGETTLIGEHVKIYQGVTLGALSTKGGRKLQNRKRHPTIEDYVTIYSGASILGGDTVIGRGSVVGGNVFITSSVDVGTRVSVKNRELVFDNDSNKVVEKDGGDGWFYII